MVRGYTYDASYTYGAHCTYCQAIISHSLNPEINIMITRTAELANSKLADHK
jgi:hypothetical protein